MLPAGTPFTTEAGFGSRANPSWYFGDGAALFNEVNAQFASLFGLRFPEIVPLDGTLTAAAARKTAGPSFGVRLTRRLTPRIGVEVEFHRALSNLRLRDGAIQAIEASRASFDAAFRGLLQTAPVGAVEIMSTADRPGDASADETAVAGGVSFVIARRGRLGVHASAGAARVARPGESITVGLRGHYQFRVFGIYPMNESDNVTVRFSDADSAVVGLFGGGLTYDVGPRHGIRIDARVHAGRNRMTTSVTASPARVTSSPFLSLPSNTSPSVQFTNTATAPASLSGSAPERTTFSGSGLDARLHLAVGYFLRF